MTPEDWRYVGAGVLGIAGVAVWALGYRTLRRAHLCAGHQPKRQVIEELRPGADPDAYVSRIGSTTLLLPASSWENARAVGLDMREVIEMMQPNAWPLLGTVACDLRLSEIYLTSLYRATGTGPHTEGRALDIGFVRRGNDPLVLLRRFDGVPAQEPELATQLRLALEAAGATQVLTPWWIYSRGTRDSPNTGAEGLDAEHLSHLHVTLAALA